MKLITFLGATRAYETAYLFPDGREHVASYCGVAIARMYPAMEVTVFVTQKARDMHWDAFRQDIEDYATNVEAVDIPDGRTERELWQIFQTVVDAVQEKEHLIFDITHGFRSLPFLSFLAVAYLRTVGQVEIEHVFYGNFEARDTSVTPNRAPVIDMTRFTELLDWMIAADRFMRFGDSSDLARHLDRARPQGPGYTKEAYQRGRPLYELQKALGSVSLALRLIRPEDALDTSAVLIEKLNNAHSAIQTFALPFVPLIHRIHDAYAPLALRDPRRQRADLWLHYERRLVRWYLERKQYAQAVALAREWLISWALLALEVTNLVNRQTRKAIEDLLGKQLQRRRGSTVAITQEEQDLWQRIPQREMLVDLFGQLGNLRNDMMHAGKRSSPMPANTMEQNTRQVCRRLDDFPLPPNLTSREGQDDPL